MMRGNPDDDPLYWSVSRLLEAYQRGDLSPTAVTERALTAIEAAEPGLGAVIVQTRDLALRQARAAERDIAAGRPGPLTGVPITVKDLFPLAGELTTFGSRVHDPSPTRQDSGAVRRLRNAGAVVVGKTNTAEFGQSATTENRLGPPTGNPHDSTRTAGGSSGGAAASVSAGLVPLALGSDGGGSIRIPAAFTGIVGVKPTHGLCPDEGGFSGMSALSSPGPLARHVDDARRMLAVLADLPLPPPTAPTGRCLAYCPRPSGHPVDAEVLAALDTAVETAAALGWRVEEIAWDLGPWREIFGPLVLSDEAADRAWLLDEHEHELTTYVRRTLRAAAALDPTTLARARSALQRYRSEVARKLAPFDAVMTPTTATTAFPHGQRPTEIAGVPVDHLWGAFPFTAPFNVAGTPAASIPATASRGMPAAVQLICPVRQDARLLAMAEELHDTMLSRAPVAAAHGTDPREEQHDDGDRP